MCILIDVCEVLGEVSSVKIGIRPVTPPVSGYKGVGNTLVRVDVSSNPRERGFTGNTRQTVLCIKQLL